MNIDKIIDITTKASVLLLNRMPLTQRFLPSIQDNFELNLSRSQSDGCVTSTSAYIYEHAHVFLCRLPLSGACNNAIPACACSHNGYKSFT